ncbi:MAG: hypothetical protein HOG39_05835 [Candidatus Marinimicrobia bacterium]|nr:hypothetical protein [Candidatus Neomarinimicrobiota bacterium]
MLALIFEMDIGKIKLTNLMLYGPGGYKFSDYIRVGFPLALIFRAMAIFLLPTIWPF